MCSHITCCYFYVILDQFCSKEHCDIYRIRTAIIGTISVFDFLSLRCKFWVLKGLYEGNAVNPSSFFRCDGNRYKWFNQLYMTVSYTYARKIKTENRLNKNSAKGMFSLELKNVFPYFYSSKELIEGKWPQNMNNVYIHFFTFYLKMLNTYVFWSLQAKLYLRI